MDIDLKVTDYEDDGGPWEMMVRADPDDDKAIVFSICEDYPLREGGEAVVVKTGRTVHIPTGFYA